MPPERARPLPHSNLNYRVRSEAEGHGTETRNQTSNTLPPQSAKSRTPELKQSRIERDGVSTSTINSRKAARRARRVIHLHIHIHIFATRPPLAFPLPLCIGPYPLLTPAPQPSTLPIPPVRPRTPPRRGPPPLAIILVLLSLILAHLVLVDLLVGPLPRRAELAPPLLEPGQDGVAVGADAAVAADVIGDEGAEGFVRAGRGLRWGCGAIRVCGCVGVVQVVMVVVVVVVIVVVDGGGTRLEDGSVGD